MTPTGSRSRVFVTQLEAMARRFAASHPFGDLERGGDVYRVEPVELEPGSDVHPD